MEVLMGAHQSRTIHEVRNGLRLGTVLPDESPSSIVTAEHISLHKKQKRERGYSYPEGFHGFLKKRYNTDRNSTEILRNRKVT